MYKSIYVLIVIAIWLVDQPVHLFVFNGIHWVGECCETNVNVSLPIEGLGVRKTEGKCFCKRDCFKRHENNIGLSTDCHHKDCDRLKNVDSEVIFDCLRTCIRPLSPYEKQAAKLKAYCEKYAFWFIYVIPPRCTPYVDFFNVKGMYKELKEIEEKEELERQKREELKRQKPHDGSKKKKTSKLTTDEMLALIVSLNFGANLLNNAEI